MKTRAFTHLKQQLVQLTGTPLADELSHKLKALEDLILHYDSIALSHSVDMAFCELLHHGLITTLTPFDSNMMCQLSTRLFAYGSASEFFNANEFAQRVIRSPFNLSLAHYCTNAASRCQSKVRNLTHINATAHCLEKIKHLHNEAYFIYSTYDNGYASLLVASAFLLTPLLHPPQPAHGILYKLMTSLLISALAYSLSTIIDRMQTWQNRQIPHFTPTI